MRMEGLRWHASRCAQCGFGCWGLPQGSTERACRMRCSRCRGCLQPHRSSSTAAESTCCTARLSSEPRMPGHTTAACPTICLASRKAGSGRLSAIRTRARECRSQAGTCRGRAWNEHVDACAAVTPPCNPQAPPRNRCCSTACAEGQRQGLPSHRWEATISVPAAGQGTLRAATGTRNTRALQGRRGSPGGTRRASCSRCPCSTAGSVMPAGSRRAAQSAVQRQGPTPTAVASWRKAFSLHSFVIFYRFWTACAGRHAANRMPRAKYSLHGRVPPALPLR